MTNPAAAPSRLDDTAPNQVVAASRGLTGADSMPAAIRPNERMSGMNPVSQSIREIASSAALARTLSSAHKGWSSQRSHRARLRTAVRASTAG